MFLANEMPEVLDWLHYRYVFHEKDVLYPWLTDGPGSLVSHDKTYFVKQDSCYKPADVSSIKVGSAGHLTRFEADYLTL
jgi:hypothetical protein